METQPDHTPKLNPKEIWETTASMLHIQQELEASEGEVSPDLLQKLLDTGAKIDEAVSSAYHIERLRRSEIDLVKDEISRLQKIAATKTNEADRCKELIIHATQRLGTPNKSGNPCLQVSYNGTPIKFSLTPVKSVHISEGANIPSELLSTPKPVQPAPDKNAIKAFLQEGNTLEGVELVTTFSLRAY
jgi:hypothetical protein